MPTRPLLTTALLVAFTVLAPPSSHGRPPNLVFILADDLGWSDLACYGSDLHESPHLDRLATEGVRFTQAYAASPVCTPTRASILTGKHPARLHMTIWHEGALAAPNRKRPWLEASAEPNLPLANVTLSEVLQDAGYHTWHVGKWHLGDAAHAPQPHGFDLNIGGTHWGAPNTFWYPYTGQETFRDWRYVPDLPFGEAGEYLTDRLTDEAIGLLDRAGERPFFLNLCYHSVHTPIEGKPELVDRYRQKLRPGLHHRNPEYAAMVHSLDQNVGRFLAALDERGLASSTAVVFTSDNGGFINQFKGTTVTSNHPLRSGKGSCYEGGLRVPLMIRWPGRIPAGEVCDLPVLSTDFYPTLLAMAGEPGDPAHNALTDGRNLLPFLAGDSDKPPARTLYWHYPHYYPTTTPVSAIRDGNWKLLFYYQEDRLELYDLAVDPSESRNLAAAQPVVAERLHGLLQESLQAVAAQLPTPNPDYQPPRKEN